MTSLRILPTSHFPAIVFGLFLIRGYEMLAASSLLVNARSLGHLQRFGIRRFGEGPGHLNLRHTSPLPSSHELLSGHKCDANAGVQRGVLIHCLPLWLPFLPCLHSAPWLRVLALFRNLWLCPSLGTIYSARGLEGGPMRAWLPLASRSQGPPDLAWES